MSQAEPMSILSDWQIITTFLPDRWREQAKTTGALLRNRKFASPDELLRVLLIHLVEGSSLRVTAAKAKQGNIIDISDVALLKRINAAGEWFRWMSNEIKTKWFAITPSNINIEGYNIRLIDGTTIQEPGATGTTWRIHYSFVMHSLACDEVLVTPPIEAEGLQRYHINKNDLLIADRFYCTRKGIEHVSANGGKVIIRAKHTILLYNMDGSRFDMMRNLDSVQHGKIYDWNVMLPINDGYVSGRVCAIKKSQTAADQSIKKIRQKASRTGKVIRPETVKAAQYFFVFTTLDDTILPSIVLELYRKRWQIEMTFKRLKSILGLGHLRKTDAEGAKSWIHGKLLVAFLIEAMMNNGNLFFPWGYPQPQT